MRFKQIRLDQGQIEAVGDAVAEILKRKAQAERLMIATRLWRSARAHFFFQLQSLLPDWRQRKIREVLQATHDPFLSSRLTAP